MSDPIVAADELCELLSRPDAAARRSQLYALLDEAGEHADLCVAEVARRGFLPRLFGTGPDERTALARWILALDEFGGGALARLFAVLIGAGHYEALMARLRGGDGHTGPLGGDALEALARARPSWGEETLNAHAASIASTSTEFALLIVPGYTPLDARRPMRADDVPAARERLRQARRDLEAFVAPAILVSGGAVHPAGTPVNEALSMREHLMASGVPPERILVEPYARHSITNLRNAGRVMRHLGLRRALIVTGFESEPFDQAFYFAHPVLSTFHQRCRAELGYRVGELEGVAPNRIAFEPSPEVLRVDVRDPLDC